MCIYIGSGPRFGRRIVCCCPFLPGIWVLTWFSDTGFYYNNEFLPELGLSHTGRP